MKKLIEDSKQIEDSTDGKDKVTAAKIAIQVFEIRKQASDL